MKSLGRKGQVYSKYNTSNKTDRQDLKCTGVVQDLRILALASHIRVHISALPLQTVYLVHLSAPHFPHLSNRFNNIYHMRLLLKLTKIGHIELIYNTGV